MTEQTANIVTAVMLSEDEIISMAELCQCCALPAERVLSMVEYGIIEPLEQSRSCVHWQFSAASVPRLQTAIRLQRDLDINLAGIALALDLLDETRSLRQLVAALQRD